MLVGFMSIDGKIIRQYEAFNSSFTDLQIRCMNRIIKLHELVGFNSKSFDDPMLTIMLDGKNTTRVYNKCHEIISNGYNYWEVYSKLNISKRFESIDLIDVAPGQAGLKLYGARMMSQKLQDLPYDPHQDVTTEEAAEVAKYNVNDLHLTLDLYNKLTVHKYLPLREKISKQYSINVMSKSKNHNRQKLKADPF